MQLSRIGAVLPEADADDDGDGEQVSDPGAWEPAKFTCSYVRSWLDGLPSDEPTGGRHQWLGDQAVRFACARRYGCLTEGDYHYAKQLVHARMVELRARTKESARQWEVESFFEAGVEKAAAKTDEQVRQELGGHDHDRDLNGPIFKVLGPTQWAHSVPDPEFLIAGVLCRDTFGVNAGPKKSLKTHDNQAIALAVASGLNLYLDERFSVRHQGKVVYIVGEGGEVPVRRTLRRMAHAYGIEPAEIEKDPGFPLVVAFGAASLSSPVLRDELCRLLDNHQPDLVLIESFYNFHPAEVTAGNLYERGQVIDAYHRLVRGECTGATSVMTDHYRSTARSKTLDLDNISMAGQAENADSWIIRDHRKEPDVPLGDFWMRTSFNSRQWGGTEWNIDWHLGEFDHEVGHHVGEISWNVSTDGAVGTKKAAGEHDSPDGRRRLIMEYVKQNPESSKTSACEVLARRHCVHEKTFRVEWEELVSHCLLVQGEGQVQRKHGDGMRSVKAKIWLPGDGKMSLESDGDDE